MSDQQYKSLAKRIEEAAVELQKMESSVNPGFFSDLRQAVIILRKLSQTRRAVASPAEQKERAHQSAFAGLAESDRAAAVERNAAFSQPTLPRKSVARVLLSLTLMITLIAGAAITINTVVQNNQERQPQPPTRPQVTF